VFPLSGTLSGREASHEPLDILDILDLAHFSDGWDLIGVHFDAALGDDVPQELAPGDPKGALFLVQLHVEVPEVSEGFFLVGDETATLPGHHDDVVDVDLHVVLDLPFEIGLHTPLVGGPRVL
jgi:hypothetical protein